MFPTWTWIVGFWIGAAVGSFLNVVIYRLPRGLSIAKPKNSFCPNCKAQLHAIDMIPILSWAIQGGKCRYCKSQIAIRYPIVEFINGTLWAIIWYQLLVGSTDPLLAMEQVDIIRAVGYMLFASALVVAIFTDIAHYIIPDQVNAVMLIIGIGMNVGFFVEGRNEAMLWGMPASVAGALVGIAVLWGIAFFGRIAFGKDAMGHGDIKMARGIGAVLLPLGAGISFALAVAMGAVFGVIFALVRNKRRAARTVEEDQDDGEYHPESLGSLLKCGLGYVLCIDVIGLVWPKLYEKWFGENPYSVEEFEENPEVEMSEIPFGPYLAAGALCVVLFGEQLREYTEAYFASFMG